MRVDDFDFNLPEERIALSPLEERDASRLLQVSEARLADRMVRELPEMLRPGDIMVFNDTRVIPAQLEGVRPAREEGGGGDVTIDITLHKELLEADKSACAKWRAFLRPAKRIRDGDRIVFAEGVEAVVSERDGMEANLSFNQQTKDFAEILLKIGAPPLPPYIARKRGISEADVARYQTVYANRNGSVAAPTAGLHFTDDLLKRIDARGVERAMVTLHVGAGTFLPVKASDTKDHHMHSEWGELDASVADRVAAAKRNGGRVVAVGTTALRLLETAAREGESVRPFIGDTNLFITPGFEFRAVDCLLTNFHLPKSTLFMLVCAFSGTNTMKQAYAHAVEESYRFYSYGDACFLERGVEAHE
ncbi:MAG: tRNA preQ1(34) S-adenosylmethionine ribosyltransferase-isomerase QueA [Pseudomonadota bacterium]